MLQARRRRTWAIFIAALIVLALQMVNSWGELIVLNRSESLPAGLYIHTNEPLEVGCIVEFEPPPDALAYAEKRWGYVPDNVRFIKPIAATAGDHVEILEGQLRINGEVFGPVLEHDGEANQLPHFLSRVLHPGEIFVASQYSNASFDSRYWGVLSAEDIIATRRPLITWGEDFDR